jgi:hypothetical protein
VNRKFDSKNMKKYYAAKREMRAKGQDYHPVGWLQSVKERRLKAGLYVSPRFGDKRESK